MAEEKIGKKDLIEKVANRTGRTKKEVEQIVNVFLDELADALVEMRVVSLHKFGRFVPKFYEKDGVKAARINFKPSGKLKEAIKESH